MSHQSAGAGRIGLAQGTALYIAAVLGTGILVLPGLAAATAGPASILAVVIVIGCAIPLAATFGALAARYPDPGGVASYARRALGATAGRAAGYWFCFGIAAGLPVLAFLGGDYLVALFRLDPSLAPLLSFLSLLPAFIVNVFGVRLAGWVQLGLSSLLLVIVVVVVSIAAPAVDGARFDPFLPHGWPGVALAVSLFVWAFAGWEVGTHISGEFRDPARDIPRATTIALVLTAAAYLALQIVTVGVIGDDAGSTDVPLIALVDTALPGVGRVVVGVIAIVVVLGVLNAYLSAFGKLGASLAVAGDLPRFFSRGAEAGGVPRRALGLTFAVACLYFGIGVVTHAGVQPFILVHTSTMVAIYTVGMLAAVVILPRFGRGWWTAVVALVLCIGLLVIAGFALIPAAVLALAAVVVGVVRRRRQRSGGASTERTPGAIVASSGAGPAGSPSP